MNKVWTILFLIIAFSLKPQCFGQDRTTTTDAWGFGFGLTYPKYVSINDATLSTSSFYGGHLFIQRNFSEHVGFRFKAAYNHVSARYNAGIPNEGNYVENNMFTTDLDFLYYFNPCEPFVMFLVAGAGANFNNPENASDSVLDNQSNTVAQFNLGVGVEISLSELWRLRGEGVYHTTGNSKIDGRSGPSNGLFGGTANDTWSNFDLGLIYYFDRGEPSVYCQIYSGLRPEDVDYIRIEEIIKKYQTQSSAPIDYNKIEELIKKNCTKPVMEDKWVLFGVNFDFNKSTIRPDSYPILDNSVEILMNNPDVKVEIQGHTDQVGSDEANDKLSLERAEAVKQYLVSKGIAPERLTIAGKGKRELLFKEMDEQSRYYNRRIEFHVK